MKLNNIRKHGHLYIKLLLGITLGIVVVLTASSAVHYVSFSNILQQKAFESDLSELKNTGHAIAITTENAQTVSFQIYRNSNIAKILYYNDPHPFDIQGAMLELNSYLNTMPFIESITVYNAVQERYYIVSRKGQRGFITGEELEDIGLATLLSNYRNFQPFTPIPRVLGEQASNDSSKGIYTYLCYDAIRADGKMNSAIAVNISADWINEGIELNVNNDMEKLYLVDNAGTIRYVQSLKQISPDSDMSNVLQSLSLGASDGYEIIELDGVKSLISYTAFDQFDWYYFRVTPYQQIISEAQQVGFMTLKIATIILIAGLLLSFFLSRLLYAPIDKITVHMDQLESQWRNSSYTIRQNALQKLLHIQSFDPKLQLDKLRRIGIQFDFTKPYHLVFIRIDQYNQLKLQSHGDILTYKFAILNISTEICSKQFQVEALDLEDDCLMLFINLQDQEYNDSTMSSILTHTLKEVQLACEEYLHLGITMTVTPISSEPHQLSSLYKQVREASLHRFFTGRGAIIDVQKHQFQQKAHNFPIGKEKRLIEALKTGKHEEAKLMFDEIMEETSQYPLQVAEITVKHLTASLENMLIEIERNGSLQLDLNSEIMLPKFESYETLVELSHDFHQLFDHITSKLKEKRSGKQEEIIRKINEIIEDRYGDPVLSLNFIADELNMSTYHISRVYRQLNQHTIVDAINQVRMKHAKQMLSQTEMSVADIATKTGYTSSSYFHRMFKKIYGVTPSEYRNAVRNAAEQ